MSHLSGKRTIVGREQEAAKCLDPITNRGKVICFIGKTGFGKSALLQYIAEKACNCGGDTGSDSGSGSLSILVTTRQTRISIPFYAWRTILIHLLTSFTDENPDTSTMFAKVVDDTGGLFAFCKPDEEEDQRKENETKNVGGVGVGAEHEGLDESMPENNEKERKNNQAIVNLIAKKQWKNHSLLCHIFPTVGIQKTSTSQDQLIDGCLVSVEELQQMALLIKTIMTDCLTSNMKKQIFLICKLFCCVVLAVVGIRSCFVVMSFYY